jgi:mRNA interferase MazF
VLAALSQANDAIKLRPAILLCQLPPFGDWLACGVSTQARHFVPEFDELVAPADADFGGSGLRHESVVRLGFLGTLSRSQIGGTLGGIGPDRLARLRDRLARHLHPAT